MHPYYYYYYLPNQNQPSKLAEMEAAFNTSSSSIPLSFSYTFTAATAAMGTAQQLTTNNNPWMDTRIWSKLPTKLLDRVIAFLPPPAFFRSRCVCKRWYSLLFSTSFLHLYIHLSPRRHCFLFFKQKPTTTTTTFIYNNNNNNNNQTHHQNREGYLFDPYDLVWHRISFSLIPPGFSPAASSGGLVCWISDEAGPKTLLLYNPLIGSVSQLPPTLRPRLFPSIGLSVGPSSIHVALAGDDLISPYAVKNISTESFHVDAAGFYSLWGTTSQLPRLCSLESAGQMVSVSQGRYLYSMNHSPFSVLGHDVVSNSWFKIQAPMRRFLRSPSLVESGGKVVLVAAVEKSKLNVPRSLRMWSLQGAATWVEIERMPQQLYVQFTEVEGGRGFECVGHGEFVVIMIRRSGNRGLLFDMLRKVWQWIPLCPYVDHDHDLRGFAYDPRLATPVAGLLDQLTLPNFTSFN